MSPLKSAKDSPAHSSKKIKLPSTWTTEQKKIFRNTERFVALPKTEQDAIRIKQGKDHVQKAIAIAEWASQFAGNMAMVANYVDENGLEGSSRELADYCDLALAKLKQSGVNLWPDIRAAKTRTRDLTVEVTAPMHRTGQFVKALERDIALSDQSVTEMHELLGNYAYHLHTLTGHFTELCERFSEAAKGIGEDYPNWPYLLSARKSIPQAFKLMAKHVCLGETCIIEASENARYQWKDLNKYLFEILWTWQNLKRAAKHREDRPLEKEILNVLTDHAFKPTALQEREAKIFVQSLELPQLNRSRTSAAKWADILVMPLIDIRESDLKMVRAFQVACKHANNHETAAIRTKLRTVIIDTLIGMAKQGSPRRGKLP